MYKIPISIFTCLLFCFSSPLLAQTVNYDDVAVIVNDSSSVSVAIGNYFAGARGIPASRIIHIHATTQETIDSLQFEDMRSQIEAELIMGNLPDTVNYLVTTKGMPLRVSRDGSCDSTSVNGNFVVRCTSVESELALILGAEAGEILKNGVASNSYAGADQHFDRDNYDIFLVSRLDAYTQQEVFDLIDRSGPGRQYSRNNAQMVPDFSYIPANVGNLYASRLAVLTSNMQPTGLPVATDADSATFLPPQQNVVGYYGMHYRPDLLQMGHTWEPGAMAYLHYSSAAATFDSTANTNGEYLLADLIREGATVALGNVYLTYLGPSTTEYELFPYYFDTLVATPYNAAEAFYMASGFLSIQGVMIGDPKTSVMADIPATVSIREENPLLIYPNPSQGRFVVEGDLPVGESVLEVRNQLGQLVMQRSVKHLGGMFHEEIDLQSASNGMYFIRLQSGENLLVRKIVVEH